MKMIKPRNHIVRNSKSCGAGRHKVRTKYSRNVKHRSKYERTN